MKTVSALKKRLPNDDLVDKLEAKIRAKASRMSEQNKIQVSVKD